MGRLQTEGEISLDDIHVEVGGTSGTICTLDDADIRALIPGKNSGDFMSFSNFYGKGAVIDTQTVNVGVSNTGSSWNSTYWRGYFDDINTGSITDGTCDFHNLATITKLGWKKGVFIGSKVIFEVTGNHVSDPGFVEMQVQHGNYVYLIEDATVSHADGVTTFAWEVGDDRPFGAQNAIGGYNTDIKFI